MARPVNEAKRKEKVDSILDGARAVFQRKGFLGVSMKDIIEECGISRGGIYLYFSSVDEVFRAVLARRNSHRSQGVGASIRENTDFFQLLDDYFAQQKQRLLQLENSLLRAAYEYLFTHRDSEDAQFQQEQMAHIKNTLQEILLLGVRQKAIRDENIPLMAENFAYTIEGLSVLALLGGLEEAHIDGQFGLMRGILLMQSALNAPLPARPLRVLVTAGDTSERIDDVRKIVNPATGRLGSLTADMFAMTGARVSYVCGRNAQMPAQEMEAVYAIETVEELDAAIGRILADGPFDCIVHSMAVSEYTLRRITTAQQLAEDIARGLRAQHGADVQALVRQTLHDGGARRRGRRLPANMADMVMVMDPAPNIVAKMRAAQPGALLIGFLLLVGVPRDALVAAAQERLRQEGCDYVLANDMEDISDAHHKAVLVAADGTVTDLNTKQEIAQAIVKCALAHE